MIGHHFFSPANVMRLLEIVRGKQSSAAVIATSMALAKRLGKVGVLVGNCRGFVGNRMFGRYQREAQFLLEEGRHGRAGRCRAVRLRHGDGAAGRRRPGRAGRRLAHPQGVQAPRAAGNSRSPGGRPALRARPLRPEDRRRLVQVRRGQPHADARSRGRADHREDGPRAPASSGGKISNEEILERTLYALVNEGATILAEGFALRAVDIDMIYIYGYGYPGLSRRPDVVCRHGGPEKGLRAREPVREGARQPVDAFAAVERTGRKGARRSPISTRRKAVDRLTAESHPPHVSKKAPPYDLSSLPVTLRQEIPAEYRDLMGHMNVMWYTSLFSRAFGGFGNLFGFNAAYFRRHARR